MVPFWHGDGLLVGGSGYSFGAGVLRWKAWGS